MKKIFYSDFNLNLKLKLICMTTLFLATNTFANEIVDLTRNSNVRSSRYFYGHENVIDLIPLGSTVEILNSRKLPSGANSLEIKILKPVDKINLNQKAPLYIWQSVVNIPKHISDTEASADCPDGSCSATVGESQPLTDVQKTAQDITQKIEDQNSEESENLDANNFDNSVKKYSNSLQVKRTIAWALEKNSGRHSRKMCYQKVKEALATEFVNGKGPGQNLIPKWFASQSAKNATTDLKKFGFINLLEKSSFHKIILDPKDAPKGAVLVYKTSLHKYGHIEIKLDDGPVSRYAADYVSDHAITDQQGLGKKYQLIGVMIKPELKDLK